MKEYLREHQEEYRKLPEDTKRLAFALVGKLQYYETLKKKGCEVDVCKAFDDHYKSGKREGRRMGRREGRREGLTQGIFAIIRVCMEFGAGTEEIIQKLMSNFSLSEKEAVEYVKKYRANDLTYVKVS